MDGRLADLPEAVLPSSAGPFATARVPEDLEELRDRELKTIGLAVSAAKISVPHLAIQTLLDQDERSEPRRSQTGSIRPSFSTKARSRSGVCVNEATRKAVAYNRYDAPRPDPKRPASLPLRLTAGSSTWQDDGSEKLEARIAEIAAGLIVEGERAYRTHLRELKEQAQRRRIEAERQRQERLRRANAECSASLLESGRLLADAENLRSLIARFGTAVADGRLDLSADQLADWRRWADCEADKLDPLLSGRFGQTCYA